MSSKKIGIGTFFVNITNELLTIATFNVLTVLENYNMANVIGNLLY